MKNSSLVRLRAACVASAFALTTVSLLAAFPTERAWQLKLAGESSGTFTESTVAAPDGKVTTKEAMAIELNRLGNKVIMKTETESVEDVEGSLVSLNSAMSSSQAETKLRARRVGDAFEIETEAGGKTYQKKIPVTGPVLGPKGVEKISRETLTKDGPTVSFQMFSPELGKVVSMTRQAVGTSDEAGRQLRKVEDTVEGVPGKQTVLIDHAGRWVRRQQAFPFGELVMEPAGEASPSAAAQPKAAQPSESYDQTMARSNIILPDARSLTRVTLRLHHKKPELGWPDLQTPRQRVLEKSADLRVIEIHRAPIASKNGSADAPPDESYHQPNAIVQSDDPEVIRLAQEITKGVDDNFEKARRLQDWVNKNLEFDLGIVLAPASEVVRNRRGTCVAYAILLAALERAAGLPSRIAMGYAYASGIWGGHAWTEVFIDGKWVALDAALYAPGTADAARLWFGASSGDDQLLQPLTGGAQMYGSVDFRIVSFERDGRTVTVPENADRFRIEENRYSNPWLGFSLTAPPQFRITKTDAVFPDRTIVALEGPKGAKVSVQLSSLGADEAEAKERVVSSLGDGKLVVGKLGRLSGEMATTAKGSCIIWKRGQSLWAITAEGEAPAQLLEQVAQGWKWTK